jgi:transforming growth factor-beta-induced protein
MKRIFLAPLLAVGLVLVGCSESTTQPNLSAAPAAATLNAGPPSDKSIVTLAVENELFELAGALTYVDTTLGLNLVETFNTCGDDQYTVFAPADSAFQNLYGLLSVVLETEIDEITDIPAPIVADVLLYHVTDGRRSSNSVVPKKNMKSISTLLEEKFFVGNDLSIQDGLSELGVRDDARINTDAFDVSACNGVVHLITQVIVPPSVVAAITAE